MWSKYANVLLFNVNWKKSLEVQIHLLFVAMYNFARNKFQHKHTILCPHQSNDNSITAQTNNDQLLCGSVLYTSLIRSLIFEYFDNLLLFLYSTCDVLLKLWKTCLILNFWCCLRVRYPWRMSNLNVGCLGRINKMGEK
jgi:hypothetical protein